MRLKNQSTFQGWIQEGRTVLSGEKASAYAEMPDGQFLGLFDVTQTEVLEEIDLTTAIILTPEEREAKRPKRIKEKHVRLKAVPKPNDRHQIRIWVGSNKEGIDLLKRNRYQFSGSDRRWSKTVSDVQHTIDGLEKLGWKVVVDD